jgi:hypothetical protein
VERPPALAIDAGVAGAEPDPGPTAAAPSTSAIRSPVLDATGKRFRRYAEVESMRRFLRFSLSALTIATLFVLLPVVAGAHESRLVLDDQYELVVGFLDEPAIAGELNGLSLRVTKGSGEAGEPVEGLAETLQAEVIFGDQTMALELEPVWQDPGHYRGIFIPTAEGDYTFHIMGEIEGNAIDESFTSSPEGFDSVQPREPLEFPKPA